MTHAFYLTGGMIGAVIVFVLMLLSLLTLAVGSIHSSRKLERSTENVRHRPSKQNPYL